MYPYFLFAAIHHLNRPRLSLSDLVHVGSVMIDLIQRSWVQFPPRSKYFFFTLCGSLIPFTKANAQWVIYGFNEHINLHLIKINFMLVNSQLVCLMPVEILYNVMFNLNIYLSVIVYIGPEKPQWGVANCIYYIDMYIYLFGYNSCMCTCFIN